MSIDRTLLEILVCPETKAPVSLASQQQLEAINNKIVAGTLSTVGGKKISEKLTAAILRNDGKRGYPVLDDIPIMLIEEGFDL